MGINAADLRICNQCNTHHPKDYPCRCPPDNAKERVLGSRELEFLIRIYNDSICTTWYNVTSGAAKLNDLGLIDLEYPDSDKVKLSVSDKGKRYINERLCKIPVKD